MRVTSSAEVHQAPPDNASALKGEEGAVEVAVTVRIGPLTESRDEKPESLELDILAWKA